MLSGTKQIFPSCSRFSEDDYKITKEGILYNMIG